MSCSKHPGYYENDCHRCAHNRRQDQRDETLGFLAETVTTLERDLAYSQGELSHSQAEISAQLEEQKEQSRRGGYLQWLHGSDAGLQYDSWRTANEGQIATIKQIDSYWAARRTELIEDATEQARQNKPTMPWNPGHVAFISVWAFGAGIVLTPVVWFIDQFLRFNEHAFFGIRVWWPLHWGVLAAVGAIGLISWVLNKLLEDRLYDSRFMFDRKFEQAVLARRNQRAAELPQGWYVNGTEAWAWNVLAYAPERYPEITDVPRALAAVGPYPPVASSVWEHLDAAWRKKLSTVGMDVA